MSLVIHIEGTFTNTSFLLGHLFILSQTFYRSSLPLSLLNFLFVSISYFSRQPTNSLLLYHSRVTLKVKLSNYDYHSKFQERHPYIVQHIYRSILAFPFITALYHVSFVLNTISIAFSDSR
jgi:hypothetical protein